MVVLDLPVMNIALQGSDTAFWWTCAIAVAGAGLTVLASAALRGEPDVWVTTA